MKESCSFRQVSPLHALYALSRFVCYHFFFVSFVPTSTSFFRSSSSTSWFRLQCRAVGGYLWRAKKKKRVIYYFYFIFLTKKFTQSNNSRRARWKVLEQIRKAGEVFFRRDAVTTCWHDDTRGRPSLKHIYAPKI